MKLSLLLMLAFSALAEDSIARWSQIRSTSKMTDEESVAIVNEALEADSALADKPVLMIGCGRSGKHLSFGVLTHGEPFSIILPDRYSPIRRGIDNRSIGRKLKSGVGCEVMAHALSLFLGESSRSYFNEWPVASTILSRPA
jgi:hypothetical protein